MTRIAMSRSELVKRRLFAIGSVVIGLLCILSAVLWGTALIGVITGIVLIANGVLVAFAAQHAGSWLVIDDDAVARDAGRRNEWRLRWAHMAAVRLTDDALRLVPLPEVAAHPQIAPALEPHDVDGTSAPTFSVPLDPRTTDAVRAAITQHAPPRLLAQSSPRPPST
jgi:hypothetical protein